MPQKKIIYSPIDNSFNNGDYPSKENPAAGFVVHRETTLNFSATENFVCLVCVRLLLKKGYEPKHIVFEHSFYILIDLFLCKITDETDSPNDLQFYYKGIVRDTPKEYCARLLKLYKKGKKELFNVDVVNKEEFCVWHREKP